MRLLTSVFQDLFGSGYVLGPQRLNRFNRSFILLTLIFAACSATSEIEEKEAKGAAPKGPAAITSFEDCVKAGNRVLKTFPPRCITKDGHLFIAQLQAQGGYQAGGKSADNQNSEEVKPNCVNRCGDHQCAQIVCQGLNCPCPESSDTCPSDCSSL